MSSQKIKSGEKEDDKKDFYSLKQAISLNSVDKSKVVVSDKWKINDTNSKFFIGYLNEDIIKSLSIILPQMSGFIKYFDDGDKNMSFKIEDRNIYLKCSEILNTIKKLFDVKFSAPLIHNEESLHLHCCNKYWFCIKVEKKTYLFYQAYLEQCKYKLKKRKPVNFIDA